MAERLHAGRIAQIQTDDLKAVAPLREIRLASVTLRGIAGEASSRPVAPGARAGVPDPPDSRFHPAFRGGGTPASRRSASSVRF